MEERKSGFVALVGRPNVGKSTLMNTLIGQKIAITSAKPQTTRNRIQTVFTDERGQIVFLDTPGMHKAKNKLGEYMAGVINHTIKDADVILWIVEASDYIGASDKNIADQLKSVKKPVVIALNKIDEMKDKKEVLPIMAKYNRLMPDAELVPVSAMKDTNTDELMRVLFGYMKEGPMYFDEDVVTDQPIRQIAAELIREKALRLLSDEIPHGIAVVIDRFEDRDSSGTLYDVDAGIVCEKQSHKAIIIGKGGEMIKKIGTQARKDIEDMLEARVNLKIWVKVRDDWRDSDIQMKNFGYDRNSL